MPTIVPIIVFLLAFVLVAIEKFNKALIAMVGASLMVILGVIGFEEAIHAIEFETIFLLMGMMMLVHIAQESRIFVWANVQLARITKGNPLLIFILFCLVTGILSSFLDNVTTILIVLPLVITLVRGMGRDPKPYIFGIVMFSHIGGALTIVGDPSSTLIGIAAGLTFNDFIVNLWAPVLWTAIVVLAFAILWHRNSLKLIGRDLKQLFISQLLIRKITTSFLRGKFKRHFVISTLVVLCLTILGFIAQPLTHISVSVTAIFGAVLLALLVSRDIDIHHCFKSIEWTTLFFFGGLFVMVGGVEASGILDSIGHLIVGSTDNFFLLLMLIMWGSAFLSMIVDNIPFVVVMLPLIAQINAMFIESPHAPLLWWALLFGAVLGGNGTSIGASVNVVAVGIAEKEGVKISFLEYFKYSFPLTVLSLLVVSVYFAFNYYA